MSNYVDNSAEVIDSDICGKSVNVYKFANIRKSSLKSFVSIGDYAIVAGVPAKIIGYRFEPEIINALQEIKWWDQPEIKLQRLKPFFKRELNSQIVQEIKRIIEEV